MMTVINGKEIKLYGMSDVKRKFTGLLTNFLSDGYMVHGSNRCVSNCVNDISLTKNGLNIILSINHMPFQRLDDFYPKGYIIQIADADNMAILYSESFYTISSNDSEAMVSSAEDYLTIKKFAESRRLYGKKTDDSLINSADICKAVLKILKKKKGNSALRISNLDSIKRNDFGHLRVDYEKNGVRNYVYLRRTERKPKF